ncbi:MAG: TetR/AcrR family transcriptional regulator [Nitratireductor sp.]|nr:TetR/AcrR family transcriptional regulator [Nitratireductor sp.]
MNTGSHQETQAEDKKTQILKATTRLLTTQGLRAFSFEAVANEAGLSRQLVRYYYDDLDALIVELCDYLGKEYQDILVAGIVKVGQVERLEFFKDFFFGMAKDHPMPENLEVYDSFFSYAVGSGALKERLHTKYKTLAQVIIHELAIAHPELNSRACQELSFLFVSMMHAHWSFVATLEFGTEHNRVARKAIDRLIDSYVKEAVSTAGERNGDQSV